VGLLRYDLFAGRDELIWEVGQQNDKKPVPRAESGFFIKGTEKAGLIGSVRLGVLWIVVLICCIVASLAEGPRKITWRI